MGFFKDTLTFLTSFSGPSEEPEPHELDRSATRRSVQRQIQGQKSITILVMGRSGSGKTSLIDAVCSSNTSGITPRHKVTTKTITYRTELSGMVFKLIDTPGFDNVGLSDLEVCVNIAEYFWDERRHHLGVNGIIYIHRAGDPVRSRSLGRYLTLLSKIFLGDAGMRHLTIFIPNADSQGLDTGQINEDLKDRNSTLGWASAYRSKSPIVLPIQDYNPKLVSELEGILQEKLIRPHSSDQEACVRAYQQKLEELHSTLDTKEAQVVKYRDAYNQIKNLHASQQDAEATLRQQLRRLQHDYTSLRSELQLQENFEQSEIVQELEDLNRQIDDISRTISAYLTDNYVHVAFGKNSADVNALEARNLTELIKLLEHKEGKCSLVSSANGEGLDIESFFDFTIRNMLCTLLVTAIFEPFHPAIDSDQSDALLSAYEDIRKREPQTRSGKWRASTFKSIYKDNNPDHVATWIDGLMHRFTRKCLNPLITGVFGSKDATMDRKHFNQMHELVKRAWDWNAKLKGEVVVLGDFRQTIHPPYSKFDPNIMNDFEPRPNTRPTSVLGTVGLGLISLRAVGGGRPPEETLVSFSSAILHPCPF
ncbi:hypothetical protein OPQ81_011671 [Rhizoctonia solani]|nr:hypothetical protein OPQ81_011671 [Rhizoctonia solani]